MKVGINASPAELAIALQTYPQVGTSRVFGAPGKGIPGWTSTAVNLLRKAGVIPWLSFKDWANDTTATAAINIWLDTMPTDVPQAWLTYHHEPEGDLLSREYRRRWTLLAKTVRYHDNAERVKLVPIHTLYPSRHKASDRYSTDWTDWIGVWQQWAPQDAAGRYIGDYIGWDCYLETTAAQYEPPEQFFAIPIGAAHQLGATLVVPELGSLRIGSDTTGAGRAAWITGCVDYLASRNVAAVNWWHSTGSAGQDYRLIDTASADAWKAALDRFR